MEDITVTSPLIPPLAEFVPYLEEIWESKWLTNQGRYHEELEKALGDYLKVPYISLFTNGTLPLMCALHALNIKGEVITTPYSFVATAHALCWQGIKPVFVDIDPATGNMDPEKIEAALTPATAAIMPVHVYGNPCRTARIGEIAARYGLPVIYDAAHTFGAESAGRPLAEAGDLATLSFHATKVYNTLEGGALICRDAQTKERIDYIRNFGFKDETTVVAPGINGKMDEVRSAYGLAALRHVDEAIAIRRKVALRYREALKDRPGIRYFEDMPGVKHNYAYFPVFIQAETYGMSRDALYEKMKKAGVYGRRYFYPLPCTFPPYGRLETAARAHLPEAYKLADEVICLPIHHALGACDVDRVIEQLIGKG